MNILFQLWSVYAWWRPALGWNCCNLNTLRVTLSKADRGPQNLESIHWRRPPSIRSSELTSLPEGWTTRMTKTIIGLVTWSPLQIIYVLTNQPNQVCSNLISVKNTDLDVLFACINVEAAYIRYIPCLGDMVNVFWKGLASHCNAKTTFTFYFSIINA